MRIITFAENSFDEFNQWLRKDKKVYLKIAKLIEEIRREPFSGTGKPEPLKGNLSEKWSRRITAEHRLIYEASDTELKIFSCDGHY